MTTHNVADLTGWPLDDAVSLAEGWTAHRQPTNVIGWCSPGSTGLRTSPPWSSEWEYGGPIIEREHIATFMTRSNSIWHAVIGSAWAYWESNEYDHAADGPTPLIAAMRAYVASKFGETVELP